jgi:hypothetical protein
MNIKEKEIFQAAAQAAGIEFAVEERAAGIFVIILKNKVYSVAKYALAAIATEIIKNELKAVKD